jgi:hypothetical protein
MNMLERARQKLLQPPATLPLKTEKSATNATYPQELTKLPIDQARISEAFLAHNYELIPIEHKPTIKELIGLLGGSWLEVTSDLTQLQGWMDLLITNRLIEANIRPPWFNHYADCISCGTVPLDFTPDSALVSCPWCHSRK